MLLPFFFAYIAVASAACVRQGQLGAQKMKVQLHHDQSQAVGQSSAMSSSTTSSVYTATPTSSIPGTTTSPSPAASSASTSQSGGSSTNPDEYSKGSGYTASFTQYSGCNTPAVACGFTTSKTGYTAAISQNFFGAGPGDGAGSGCSKCWSLTSSTAGIKPITVQVNNLCPAGENAAMCAQSGLTGTNSVGMNINFDLCEDDGTSAALFGGASVGMTTGMAVEVPC